MDNNDVFVRKQMVDEDAAKQEEQKKKQEIQQKKNEKRIDKFNARKSGKYSKIINKLNTQKADKRAEEQIRKNYSEDKAAQLIRDARYDAKKKEIETGVSSSRFVKQNVDALLANPERKFGRFAMEKGLFWNPPPMLQREEATGLPVARLKDKRPPMFDRPKMFERKTNSLV